MEPGGTRWNQAGNIRSIGIYVTPEPTWMRLRQSKAPCREGTLSSGLMDKLEHMTTPNVKHYSSFSCNSVQDVQDSLQTLHELLPLHGTDFSPKIKAKQTNRKVTGSVWRCPRFTVNALVYSKRSSAKLSPPADGKPGRRTSQEATNAGRYYCPPVEEHDRPRARVSGGAFSSWIAGP